MAGEVCSRTSSSSGLVGPERALPLAVCSLNPEHVLEPMRNRQAPICRTFRNRPGQAKAPSSICAQSYSAPTSSSHFSLSSFCQGLCCGTSRQSGAIANTTPSLSVGFHRGATRFTSSRNVRNSSTKLRLRGNLLALLVRGAVSRALHKAIELALLVGELGRHHVVLKLEEGVTREPMCIEPDAVLPRRKYPVARISAPCVGS